MLAFIAGVIILSCAFCSVVPKGVTVNGIAVGGMTREEAAATVRSETEKFLKEKWLKIYAGKETYVYTYPEISYSDNVYGLLKNAEKGGNYTSETTYYLCGLSEIASAICRSESVDAVEPYAEFSASGKAFAYYEGNDGKQLDEGKLRKDILKSLEGGFEPVNAVFIGQKRTKKMEDVKKSTRLLSTFTTYFDSSNLNRTSNIRLAASKLNGSVLKSGQTLSFNDIVGARVKERGFLSAKIIENGEFKDGIGGGVCQVSTTLYNAALLSGMKIVEYHPHSLAVGYVSPSRDAMVSGKACDLKISNIFPETIYIRAKVSGGGVTFSVYGGGDGAEYSVVSEVTGALPAPEEHTDEPDKARNGKDGTLSEGYLLIKRGEYVKKVLLRKDKYAPVKRVVYDEPAIPEQQTQDMVF